MSRRLNVPGKNRILEMLPTDVSTRMERSLQRKSFAIREMLYEANAPIEHGCFPLGGVMSLVIMMEDGGAVEVGTIGNEGMVGTPVLLGASTSPTMAFCQVPGDALLMPVDAFRQELDQEDQILHRLLRRYTQAMVNQISQSVACNHLHSVEERACRWLLMTHDRVGQDQFHLTQEFLAQMLGVRRPSVTVAAGMLEKSGLITYQRGHITIPNRAGLEAASCECYHIVRQEYEKLLARIDWRPGMRAP